MEVVVHELDLTTLSIEKRVDFLYKLLVNHTVFIQFNLSADPNETMTMLGCYARGFAYAGAENCEPLTPWKINPPDVVLQFLNRKLRETNQAVFNREPRSSTYVATEFDVVRKTGEIDWNATIWAIKNKKIQSITVISSANADHFDKITVTSIEGAHYNVRTDCMGLNSDDKEVIACEKAILTLYKSLFPS